MKGKRHDYSQLLIWAAVLVTVVRYAGAFIASDLGSINGWLSEALSIGMGLSGLGMGVLDVLGGAYLFDGWRKAMPRAGQRWPFRFKVLTVFVMGLFIVGIGILVPFTVSRVSHQGMYEVLGAGLWFWSIAVNIAPYLLVGGVVTAQSGVVGVTPVAANQPTQPVLVGFDPTNQPNQPNLTNQRVHKASTGKRDLIAQALNDNPAATNIAIAGEFGVTDVYVGRIRKEINNGKGKMSDLSGDGETH